MVTSCFVAHLLLFVLVQDGCGMPLLNDQDAVEEFAADAAEEALGDRVRSCCSDRCLDDADVDGAEDSVEGIGEFGVAVPNEEPEVAAGVVEVHAKVASLLGEPVAVGLAARDVHPASGVLTCRPSLVR
jgi:hypothetical protein